MMKEKQTSGMEWMYSILNGASIAMLVAVLAYHWDHDLYGFCQSCRCQSQVFH